MEVVVIEREGEELVIDLGRVPPTVHVGVERPTDLALAVFVRQPAQHEVTDQSVTVALEDRDAHHVVLARLLRTLEATAQDLERRRTVTGF